jgi:hypothetical protein
MGGSPEEVDEAAGQLTKINDIDKLSRAPISVMNRGEVFSSPRFSVTHCGQ